MLIPKNERKVVSFNMDDQESLEAYNTLLNNPAIKVIERRFEKHTESQFSEDYNTTKTELHVYLEVEECTF